MGEVLVVPRRHNLATMLMATMWGVGALILAWLAALRLDSGEHVTPWTWVAIGAFLMAAALTYWWEELWRALHPPMRFEPDELPTPFDWGEVARRMATYRDTEGADDSPEESDSVYLMILDTVTLEYVDIVREILSRYDGAASRHPIEPELGTDSSGRAFFVSSKEVWKLDPPIVLPSPHRNELILVDRIDAEARQREDGPWRWTVMHARAIDRATGEVGEHHREFSTAPGVSDLFGPRQVIGA